MTSAFYSKAQGIIVCFDVSQKESFQALPGWIRDIRRVRVNDYDMSVYCS